MRTRAYRPEPVRLEDRSLQSGFARWPAHPVVLPRRRFNFILDHIRSGFVLFDRYHDVSQVHSEVDDVIVMIPFQRLDGLNDSIDRIVQGMQQDVAAHVPGAVRLASLAVAATTVADVQARVRAGDVILT